MLEEILLEAEDKMQKAIEVMENRFLNVRAGRANPKILDKVMVEYYGAPTPLIQLATISVPEARMIQIQPWDTSLLKAIEKAINTSDLGIHPSNDGKVIRLVFPELSEERRKDLNKDVKKKAEASKVAIRNIRRDALDVFKKQEKKKEITEDILKDLEEEMQKMTDKYIAEIDKKCDAKCKDILAV